MTATPSPEELVERLEALVGRAIPWSHANACLAMTQAAALIRELVKQARDRMDFQFKQSQLGVKDMKRIMELEEALKPFATSSARDWDEDAPDDTEVWSSQGPGWCVSKDSFTVGDLRRAAKALDPYKNGFWNDDDQ